MASFMTKKKKYKFQVEICLEELLEVPFVSAVLFAKLRLLDGGNFQDRSSRQEVQDHKVNWGATFTFPCKMMANASTGVMERCVLRISIRKESKGGRSFNKLGFIDLNLAEYAGAGLTHKKALLEGYDARHRQDNSMLKFKIELNMISGDILFKAPSPSLKHKQVAAEETPTEQRSEEFSGDSLAGSIASGSSGFGSLPKKRPALLASELVIGQTLTENNIPVTISSEGDNLLSQVAVLAAEPLESQQELPSELGHSRNSSNTSQLSKASGYSSIHSHTHSRHSSSGDSGHIRNPHSRSVRAQTKSNTQKFFRTNTFPKKINIPNTISSSSNDDSFFTPEVILSSTPIKTVVTKVEENTTNYSTPKGFQTQVSYISNSSADEYKTPECSFINSKTDLFSQNFNQLQKSTSTSVVERIKTNMLPTNSINNVDNRLSLDEEKKHSRNEGVLRSKSEFEIPRLPNPPTEKTFSSKFFKSESLISFLTPRPKRKNIHDQSSPNSPNSPTHLFKAPGSPNPKLKNLPEKRTTSLSSLRSGNTGNDGQLTVPSVPRNPSTGSLILYESGSLDRAKAAYERRKKNQAEEADGGAVTGRVEITRVNPDDLIEELLKGTNLEQPDESAETSGLQLFIAKDGTAALGNHEVKSQMSTGARVFKQVVMDDDR